MTHAPISPRSRAAALGWHATSTLALVVWLVLVLGCHDSPSEPRGEISFQSLAKTTLPRFGPEVRTVVRDEASWEATWRELWGDAPPPRPQIDFRREMAVVATASLSCFGDVAIEGVDRDGGELTVRIADAGPPTLCLCIAPMYTFH
ncbi:MAG TPA: hypothetical protein VFS60_13240, partial [Thermoanaerobaculia bacterium]|nr:hypothetical protein [Thermoanaerobaculia bacterium]